MMRWKRIILRVSLYVSCLILGNHQLAHAQHTPQTKIQEQLATRFMEFLEKKNIDSAISLTDARLRTDIDFRKSCITAAAMIGFVYRSSELVVMKTWSDEHLYMTYTCRYFSLTYTDQNLYQGNVTFANDTSLLISDVTFLDRGAILESQKRSREIPPLPPPPVKRP